MWRSNPDLEIMPPDLVHSPIINYQHNKFLKILRLSPKTSVDFFIVQKNFPCIYSSQNYWEWENTKEVGSVSFELIPHTSIAKSTNKNLFYHFLGLGDFNMDKFPLTT